MSGAAAVPAGGHGAYLEAILDGDRRRAFRVVDDALGAGLALGALYVEVIQPAMQEVGRLWQENRISVADEHLATAITQSVMAHAFQGAFEWDAGRGRSLVAACVDAERHEVGLRMICDLLEVRGWDATYLGASVPVASLVEMVRGRRPDAVALSVAIAPHLPRLRDAIRQLRAEVDPTPLVLVGGRPFVEDPALAERLGADLTAADALQAVELLQRRLGPA